MPDADDPLLRIEHVGKAYGGLAALREVSLTVGRGEICGVIGPNGAGKSTLFGIIAGAIRPTTGRVLFKGRDVTHLPTHHRARLGIARTFQLAHVFESMTVAQNVLIGAEPHSSLGLIAAATHLGGYRARDHAAWKRADEAIAQAGLAAIRDLPGSALTFGQQRLVATARALAGRPELLLLDEPAAGLSSGDIDILCDATRRARENGSTVLIVEHNMEVISRLCERIVVLHLGEKIADGAPGEVRQSARVLEAYLGT